MKKKQKISKRITTQIKLDLMKKKQNLCLIIYLEQFNLKLYILKKINLLVKIIKKKFAKRFNL